MRRLQFDRAARARREAGRCPLQPKPQSPAARLTGRALPLLVASLLAASPSLADEGDPGAAAPSEAPPASEAPPPSEADDPPTFAARVTLGLWVAGLGGHLQTPRAGKQASTSDDRPTVEEVGLDGYRLLPTLDVSLVFLGAHELHVSLWSVRAKGRDRLNRALVSQSVHFPAGDRVIAHLDLEMARLTYRPRWLTLALGPLEIVPEAGVSLTIFDYRLRDPFLFERVDRRYSFAAPYLGLLADLPLLDELALEVELGGSLYANGVRHLDAEARLVFTPWQAEVAQLGLVLGVRGVWLRRKDGQPAEQNDPNLRMGAFAEPAGGLTIGVRCSF